MTEVPVTLAPVRIVQDQVAKAGLTVYLQEIEVGPKWIKAHKIIRPDVLLIRLRADTRFLNGVFHGLHPDVGRIRHDFRSIGGSFGKGSLQCVYGEDTGIVYFDVDKHNPYEDVKSNLGHTGEVLVNWWNALTRKERTA